MEVKILCPCGSKYKFDVEPVNGKLPGPVHCPVCGAEGTAAGNDLIAQTLIPAAPSPVAAVPSHSDSGPRISIPGLGQPKTGAPVAPAPAIKISAPAPATASPSVVHQPAPVAAAPASVPHPGMIPKTAAPAIPRSSADVKASAPAIPRSSAEAKPMTVQPAPATMAPAAPTLVPTLPAPGASRLSVAAHKPEPAPVEAHSPSPAAQVPTPTPAARPSRPVHHGPSTMRGVIGAVIGGAIGSTVWIVLTMTTMIEFKIIAWALGAFTGWLAVLIAKGRSPHIGMATAAVACVAILLSQVITTALIYSRYVDSEVKAAFDFRVAYAKEAMEAKTDEDYKKVIAENASWDDELILSPEDVKPERLAAFKTKELPELKRVAEGKTSRSEIERQARVKAEKEVEEQGGLLRNSFGLWTLIWLFAGVSSAFRIGTGSK